jgi:hypothetical protein
MTESRYHDGQQLAVLQMEPDYAGLIVICLYIAHCAECFEHADRDTAFERLTWTYSNRMSARSMYQRLRVRLNRATTNIQRNPATGLIVRVPATVNPDNPFSGIPGVLLALSGQMLNPRSTNFGHYIP